MKNEILRSAKGGRLMFWCPGCDGAHAVQVGEGPGPRWGFNGDHERPTFTPSVLVRGTRRITDAERDLILSGEKIEPERTVCHSFVTDGQIQFLNDCTHALAGQTVPLRPFDE